MKNLLGELYDKIFEGYKNLSEIRIRKGKPIIVKDLFQKYDTGIMADGQTIERIINVATKYSKYAYEEELRQGYLYYANGIRIGVGGRYNVKNKEIITFKEITSLCIRIPQQIIGCSKKLAFLTENYKNTIIISPPFGGKTTLIRDFARVLAEKHDVLIVDERYELGGYGQTMNLGKMSDVLQGAEKKYLTQGAIRALNPEIVVFDELFSEDDFLSVKEFVRSGIRILAGLHGDSLETAEKFCHSILEYFNNIVVLESIPTVGSIKSIIRR